MAAPSMSPHGESQILPVSLENAPRSASESHSKSIQMTVSALVGCWSLCDLVWGLLGWHLYGLHPSSGSF